MKKILIIFIFGVLATFSSPLLAKHASGKSESTPTTAPSTGLANPASVNCMKKGGKLEIKKRGDGGEYGVCLFEDNRQCEEWALMHGECPEGGVKITGFTSPEQIYCAIVGGKTFAKPKAKCTFPDGSVCEDLALYEGKCQKGQGKK